MTKPCQECGTHTRPSRSNPADYPDGMLKLIARGLCERCYSKWRRGTLGSNPPVKTTTGRAERLEDIEFLLQFDGNAESVARRAGFTSAHSAERALQRWGRFDLANILRRYARNIDVYHDNYTAA